MSFKPLPSGTPLAATRRLALGVLLLAALPAMAGPAFMSYQKAAFDAAVKSGAPVLVLVHATWCSTCKRQSVVLGELLEEPAFKAMTPILVNYDTDAEFKSAWKTPDRSTILVFRDGKETGRVTWETGKDAIRQLLAGKPKA